MKKVLLLLSLLFMTLCYAQEINQVPQISVTGEGKVKVIPDQATITATVQTKGNNAKEVKKENDQHIEAVLKIIKKMNVAAADYKTQRVLLNPIFDYEKKKTTYNAIQTVEILLRDLSQYDALMEGWLMKESTKLIMWFFSLQN
jgi:uncharacterized protein YggE